MSHHTINSKAIPRRAFAGDFEGRDLNTPFEYEERKARLVVEICNLGLYLGKENILISVQ